MTDLRDLLAAIDTALSDLPQPDSRFERDRWRIVSRVALDAVEPLIRAGERERIAVMADEERAVCTDPNEGTTVPFSAFLRAAQP